MSWLEMDQIILALSLLMAGHSLYSLALWLLPAIAVAVVVGIGSLFTIAWVLTK